MSNYSGGNIVAGWDPDPYQRHQTRYWNGAAWTEHVADNGVQTVDAMLAPSAPVAAYPASPPYTAPYTAPYGAPPVAQRSGGSPAVAILLITAGAAGVVASWLSYLTLKFDSAFDIGSDSATGWEVQKALGASDHFSYSMIAAVLACALVGVLGIVFLVNRSSATGGGSPAIPAISAIVGVGAAIFTVFSYTLTDSMLDDARQLSEDSGYTIDVSLGIGAGFVLQLAAAVAIVIAGIIGIAGANKHSGV